MERASSPFSVPPPVAAVPQRTQHIQFRRAISLIGAILIICAQCLTVLALDGTPSSSGTTNLNDINSDNSRRSGVDVVVNSTSELGASSSSKIVRDSVGAAFPRRLHHHHHRRRFQTSSYARASLLRNPQHQYQQKRKKDVANLRKLSSDSGCLTDPSMCLTVAGWTTESFASTCCHNGWCTDIHFDGLNCGGCGSPCKFGYLCCSGICVATESDPMNCGSCANVCQGGTCSFGLCGYSTMDFLINSTDSR